MAIRECDCKEFQDSGHTDECNVHYKPQPAALDAMRESTMHLIALLASDKAKDYREEEKEDKEFMGKSYDPNAYGSGFNKGAAEALEQFAEDLWLRMNDEEINHQSQARESEGKVNV